jgi:hypothetical protein
LRDACVAEFGGVVLAIGLGWLLGLLPIAFNATPEMLARTSPTLIDLFVATLAGLAGCLAMIDERISPALPGILVPVGGGAALGSAATSAVVSGTLNVGQEVGPENLRTMAKKTAKAIIKDVSPRIYELGWLPPTKAR